MTTLVSVPGRGAALHRSTCQGAVKPELLLTLAFVATFAARLPQALLDARPRVNLGDTNTKSEAQLAAPLPAATICVASKSASEDARMEANTDAFMTAYDAAAHAGGRARTDRRLDASAQWPPEAMKPDTSV